MRAAPAQRITAQTGKRPLLKGVILVIFLLAAIAVAQFTPVKSFLTPAGLGRFLERAGLWGPVIFVLVYAAGVCLFIPGTLLTTLGGAIFGAYQGFLYVWVGAMLGSSASFWIGRTLGRDLAASLVGVIHSYPTQAEAIKQVADLYNRTRLTPFVRKLLAWWLKWMG